MAPGKVNINGTWKDVAEVSAKVNGAWKTVTEGYNKVNGTWQQWFAPGSAVKLIASTTLSSDVASFTFSNIPNTFEHLFIIGAVDTTGIGGFPSGVKMYANGIQDQTYGGGGYLNAGQVQYERARGLSFFQADDSDSPYYTNNGYLQYYDQPVEIHMPFYSNSQQITGFTTGGIQMGWKSTDTLDKERLINKFLRHDTLTTITSLTFAVVSGDNPKLHAGTRINLYGVAS